ncbi:hypothetical protein Tco_1379031 [Tanacetum coccineum]
MHSFNPTREVSNSSICIFPRVKFLSYNPVVHHSGYDVKMRVEVNVSPISFCSGLKVYHLPPASSVHEDAYSMKACSGFSMARYVSVEGPFQISHVAVGCTGTLEAMRLPDPALAVPLGRSTFVVIRGRYRSPWNEHPFLSPIRMVIGSRDYQRLFPWKLDGIPLDLVALHWSTLLSTDRILCSYGG